MTFWTLSTKCKSYPQIHPTRLVTFDHPALYSHLQLLTLGWSPLWWIVHWLRLWTKFHGRPHFINLKARSLIGLVHVHVYLLFWPLMASKQHWCRRPFCMMLWTSSRKIEKWWWSHHESDKHLLKYHQSATLEPNTDQANWQYTFFHSITISCVEVIMAGTTFEFC